jgi:lipopolysaccharide/colanic/teichoic acid biosynthesis glycosyltransferase
MSTRLLLSRSDRPASGSGDPEGPAGPRTRPRIASKRVLDLAIAVPSLLLLAPLMLMVAVVVRLTSPGPVLLRQTRIGRHERPFTMLKFRTMHIDADDLAHREFNRLELLGELDVGDGVYKLKDDERITPVGRFLRRFSIDELPQLLNVLRGEMSIVGPRPSLPWEVELYGPEQRRRQEVLPGMTGLWQVSGRNRLSMPEMLALDVAYVEQYSLRLDLAILLRTPWAVLFDDSVR